MIQDARVLVSSAIRFAVSTLSILLCASAAPAQVNTLEKDNPREEARLKAGPFYLSPSLVLTDLGVDSNVFNETGDTKQDFTATLYPSATVWMPFARRGLLKAELGAGLVWFREFTSERSVDPRALVRGEAYLRRLTIFGEVGFDHSRQRPNFEIDLRSRRTHVEGSIGADFRLSSRLSSEVFARRSVTEFDSDAFFRGTRLEETLNRESEGFGIGLRQMLTVLTSVVLRAERFEERFPLSPERGADNVRALAGVEFQPRALVRGSLYVGLRHLNPVDEALLPQFAGVVSRINLAHTVMGSTTVSFTHSRDVDYSFEPTQPYYVDNSIGTMIRRAVGRRFDVVASLERHAYAYRELASGGESLTPRVDTSWVYGASLGYRLGRDGRFGFGLSRWKRTSNAAGSLDMTGIRVGTSASYGF